MRAGAELSRSRSCRSAGSCAGAAGPHPGSAHLPSSSPVPPPAPTAARRAMPTPRTHSRTRRQPGRSPTPQGSCSAPESVDRTNRSVYPNSARPRRFPCASARRACSATLRAPHRQAQAIARSGHPPTPRTPTPGPAGSCRSRGTRSTEPAHRRILDLGHLGDPPAAPIHGCRDQLEPQFLGGYRAAGGSKPAAVPAGRAITRGGYRGPRARAATISPPPATAPSPPPTGPGCRRCGGRSGRRSR